MQESRLNKNLTIGLTGGIGSGKSTVSKMFQKFGAEIIDADEISRILVSKGSPLLEKILDHFGPDVADASGGLDRQILRDRIFHDPGAKAWLEALMHPAIREEIQRRITESDAAYVVVVVPLLVESGSYEFLDRVIVVDAPEAAQIARIQQRDGSSPELIEKMLAAQSTRQERLDKADDVIDNSGSLDSLESQVRKLHEHYQQLATD